MLQLLLEHMALRWTALASVVPRGVAVVASQSTSTATTSTHNVLQEWLWFAVPKSRVTRHKKRLKTTAQKRIPLRQDIVTDPRTGETTRLHRLPFNWKDYLPSSSS